MIVREWFVYMLACGPRGSLYVGRTTDVERRYDQHRAGTGGRFTRAFPPTAVAWVEGGHDASSSAIREAELKRWSRARKLRLAGEGGGKGST